MQFSGRQTRRRGTPCPPGGMLGPHFSPGRLSIHEGARRTKRYPQRPKKEIHEGPRRTTKGHEGVGENSRGIRQRLGREKRFPPRAIKDLLRGQKMNPRRDSKGLEAKGIREEPRRTLRFSTNAHSKIEPISFLCTSFSSCLSCLSCVSMFNDAANRISETWPLLPIGIRTGCFTLE